MRARIAHGPHGAEPLSAAPGGLRGGPTVRLPLERVRRAPQGLGTQVRLPDPHVRHARAASSPARRTDTSTGLKRAGSPTRTRRPTRGRASRSRAAPRREPAPEKPRITIADACKVFITNREAAGLAPATLRKYRTFAKQISDYADSRGYVMLDQFTPDDIDLFWANWKLGAAREGQAPHHAAGVLPVLRQPQVDP